MIAAHRTLRIPPDLDLPKLERQGVEEEQAIDQRVSRAQEELDRLQCLQAPDEAAQAPQDTRLRAARHEPGRGRGRIEAAVAALSGDKDRHLPLKAEDAAIHHRLLQEVTGVI